MNDTSDIPGNGSNSTCEGLGNRWWAYIAIDAALYFGLLSAFLLAYLIYWVLTVKYKVHASDKVTSSKAYSACRFIRNGMRQLISGDTYLGKILITVTLICNLIFLGLTIHRSFVHSAEECIDNIGNPETIIELIVVIELLFFGLVRFLACNHILFFWIKPHTIVDVLTLSHIFIAMYFGVDWIGFRSLRFIWLTQVVLVLQFTPLLRSQNAVEIAHLLTYFLILWFTSSGILHLIEAQGDFWRDDANPHPLLIYVYLTMVTMSTVGYGDFFPVTDLGRGFMILFIIGGLALFAAILPTLVEVVTDLYAKYQYAKFDTTRVPRHVIVCGHVTATTATDFLKDFLHPDRGDTQTHVLFLHPERPDKDLKNVLRLYYTRVQFLLGSVLNGKDLKKAHICSSTAIFILANKHTDNPTEEDHANLLRVVSVKNTTDSVPIIIQVLLGFSKIQVSSIEGWSYGRDIAVCLNELKLGLLAQSCLCPGFSTLIANLFYTSDFPHYTSLMLADKWKEHYIKGASNEVYYSTFSEFFDGMTFHEAAAVCFNKLNLVMLALEKIEHNFHRYYVNPSPERHSHLRINTNTMLGYFIAQDQDHVSVVGNYCECCLGSRHRTASMEQAELKQKLSILRRNIMVSRSRKSLGDIELGNMVDPKDVTIRFKSPSADSAVANRNNTQNRQTITNGNGEIQPANGIHKERRQPSHLLETLHEEENEDDELTCEKRKMHLGVPVQLEQSILNPDRFTCNKPNAEIKDHIVLCLFADGNSPHLGIQSFLKPLRSKHLPEESIKPVVIVCEKAFIEKEWLGICDTPKLYVVVGSPLFWSNLEAARVSKSSVCVILTMLHTSSGHEPAIDDKEAILCSLSIQKKLKQLKKDVLVITDLRQESNVQFLDFGDEDTPDERIYKAQPFACGEAFSVSMFDSITSSVFHGPGSLYLVEDLIHSAGTKTVCQVISQPIHETSFAGKTFGEFYNEQLKDYKICMGLSRKLSPVSNQSYVITSPDSKLILEASDIAFVLS